MVAKTSKCTQVYESIYKHSISPACFGRSCGHPQGNALEDRYIEYYKSF